MVKEAQSHAAEDQRRRELIDARNEADALAYSVEKTLADSGDRVSAADRSQISSAIAALRTARFDEMTTPTLVVVGDKDNEPQLTSRGASYHAAVY